MSWGQKLVAILFGVVLFATVVLPFSMILMISVTHESTLNELGYRLIPSRFSLTAYAYVLQNFAKILRALFVTAAQAVVGAVSSVLFMAMLGYSLSRLRGRLGIALTAIVFICYFIDWGLLPNYILNSRYLHLKDSFLIYVLPSTYNSFIVLIMKGHFSRQSPSVMDAARIDGANEMILFFRIAFPISKSIMAGLMLISLVWRWNDWFTSLLYVSNENLYTLQYLLERILREEQFVRRVLRGVPGVSDIYGSLRPILSVRFAICTLCVLPVLFLMRPFLKAILKGLMSGDERE